PWVTSVGSMKNQGPEIAARLSGHGFSIYFPRPTYQNAAVPTSIQHFGNQYNAFYKCVLRGDLA
ncbi:hypothetical protein EDB87DRAFT_1569044, partial [Lactarius vividus]